MGIVPWGAIVVSGPAPGAPGFPLGEPPSPIVPVHAAANATPGPTLRALRFSSAPLVATSALFGPLDTLKTRKSPENSRARSQPPAPAILNRRHPIRF